MRYDREGGKLLYLSPRRISYAFLLPIAELAIWSAVVLIPTFIGILTRRGWLAFSLEQICQRQFHLIADLNLPGLLLGAPVSIPTASFLREHPATLSQRTWHTLTIPFFCLPVWWFVGRAYDNLLARKRLHWPTLAILSILSCACLVVTTGILTAPPNDRPDLMEFVPGCIFWALAFGLLPVAWALRRRRVNVN